MTDFEHREVSAVADEETAERTAWVRIGYARTEDGRVDSDRIGTVEQMPYYQAKQLVKDGYGQFVDGPDDDAAATPEGDEAGPVPMRLTEPAVPGAAPAGFVRTRRNDPAAAPRMGGWGAAPAEKPEQDPAQAPAEVAAPKPAPVTPVTKEAAEAPAPAESAPADVATATDEATATVTASEQE